VTFSPRRQALDYCTTKIYTENINVLEKRADKNYRDGGHNDVRVVLAQNLGNF